jgi:hypothetical protein
VGNIRIVILFGLFTGWREDKETYRGLQAEEDMSGVPQNFIFFEIVRKRNFSSSQLHALLVYTLLLFRNSHYAHITALYFHIRYIHIHTQYY